VASMNRWMDGQKERRREGGERRPKAAKIMKMKAKKGRNERSSASCNNVSNEEKQK